jgi:hypothetical protein
MLRAIPVEELPPDERDVVASFPERRQPGDQDSEPGA